MTPRETAATLLSLALLIGAGWALINLVQTHDPLWGLTSSLSVAAVLLTVTK